MTTMTDEKALYQTTRIVWYVFSLLESLLLLRFILRLLGANPDAGFTELVYGLTSVPLAPFTYVFSNDVIGGSAIEWSTLLAMVVYFLIAKAIVQLITMGRRVDRIEADQALKQQDEI